MQFVYGRPVSILPRSTTPMGIPIPSHTQNHQLIGYINSWLFVEHLLSFLKVLQLNQTLFFSDRNFQCESDFRPFNMRRRITSMPLCVLILLIHPWVLLRLMFLGWYSVPLFFVRTCWYCQGSCWNNPEPSACEEMGPHLEIWDPTAVLDTIQLLSNLKWEAPVTARFAAVMLLREYRSER